MRRWASSPAPTGHPTSTIPETRALSPPIEKEFSAVPATYAFQAYDAALLIDSAVRKIEGSELKDREALRAAMMKADSLVAWRLQVQRQPLSDPGLLPDEGRQGADGKFETEIVKKVFENYADRTSRIAG